MSPEEYRRLNPLGGPATMFEAIASRLRAGEDYAAVLADYRLCSADALAAERAKVSAEEERCQDAWRAHDKMQLERDALRAQLAVLREASFKLTAKLVCIPTSDKHEELIRRETVIDAVMEWRRAVDAALATAQREQQ